MKCRFCKAKIKETDKKCPHCKKADPQPLNNPVFTAKKRTAIMFGSIAALAVLGIVLLIAMLTGWDLGSGLKPKENNVFFRNNYSVSSGRVDRNRDEVIATMGDMQLTNGQLQVYYWMQVYEFVGSYGDSAAYLGLDITENLAKQMYTDGKRTWQQYFLESALQMWQSNQAFAILAEQSGFVLPEDYQELVDNMEQRLEDSAKQSGYASAAEMVRKEIGPGCTVEDYAQYLRTYYTGYLYFRECFDAIEPTAKEIEDYFKEHESTFTEAGITKDSSVCVDFRHIMLFPEGGSMYPDGSVYYTEDAWEMCKSEAERVLSQWRAGERTEDSFAELVSKYSQDETTVNTGGLYSDVVKGDMQAAIETWCFDANRKNGDCSIVKTDYGYHILFFMESEEVWYAKAKAALREELGKEMVDEVLAQYALEVNYKEIVLGKVKMSK